MIHFEKASVRPAPAGGTGRFVLILAGTVILVLAAAVLARAEEVAPADPGTAPCTAPEHRQFDFWVGEWEVWTEKLKNEGKPPARSRISLVEGGCVVQEEFTTSTGYSGRSLNYYDRRDGKWHQTWIDNRGEPLVQVGGMQGKSMILEAPGPGGAQNRITWTPVEGGRVRQHWIRSTDGGRSWSTLFDGMYHPLRK